MTGNEADRVAVVGAGIAGLACAEALAAAGRAVTVFEKSRGLGGRCATRLRGGPAFDHGAPCAEVRDPAFAAAARAWAEAGHAANWDATGPEAIVGLPGMNALAEPMARGLDVRFGAQVTALAREGGGWRLAFADGRAEERAGTVLLAIPGPQAAELAGRERFEGLGSVAMEPCWTVMAAWDRALDAPEPVIEGDGSPLAKALRNAAKPGRDALPDAWVLHAGPVWTAEKLEIPHEEAGAALLGAFGRALGADLPEPGTLMIHRWLYARVTQPLGQGHAWDGEARLGLAGDWCEGPGIEAAWQSGRALAEAVITG